MARLKDIDQAIGAQKAAMLRLQRQIERCQADVETLERARTLLSGRDAATRHRERGPVVREHPNKGILGPDSDAGRAHAVLTSSGHTLHVDEIIAKIAEKHNRTPKRTSLIGALSRYAKHGVHFVRIPGKPNTFGLVEWRKP